MEPTAFQTYKLIGVAGAFTTSAVLQWIAPYRGQWRAILSNWKINFGLGLVGSLVMGLLCGGCVCALSERVRLAGFGLFSLLGIPVWGQVVLTVLVLDLTAFAWHRANHAWPFLWRFHSVHHSDRVFDASTAVRFHPGELVISLGARLLVVVVFGVPIVGLLVFEIVYAFFNFFEHGDTRLSPRLEAVLGKVFVVPALHRKHHSEKREELNTNFGTIFSFWDRCFRTFQASRSDEDVTVGLESLRGPLGLGSALVLPFKPK